MRRLLTAVFFSTVAGLSQADDASEAEPIAFRDLSGKAHTLFADRETKAVVIVFISTDCPIANFFQPTLRRLQEEFEPQGVLFYQVHPDSETPLADAKRHRKDFGIRCPVAIDHGQALVKRLDAKVTPEAFVITPDRETAYRGRINDVYTTYGKRRPQPTKRDLAAALTAVLAGETPPVTVTEAVGCQIFIEEEN